MKACAALSDLKSGRAASGSLRRCGCNSMGACCWSCSTNERSQPCFLCGNGDGPSKTAIKLQS